MKSVSLYLERFQKYGVLKKYNFLGHPVYVCNSADFSLEEAYLFGALCITIVGLKGLKQSAGLY